LPSITKILFRTWRVEPRAASAWGTTWWTVRRWSGASLPAPAYQHAWFESSQPSEPTERGAAALVFGSRFDWNLTQRLDLILEYLGQYTSREVGETTHHAAGTLSIDLTQRLDLDVSFIWDRISNPKIGADGVQPKPDDFRLVVGLGVDF
jgi:hypothetical protein